MRSQAHVAQNRIDFGRDASQALVLIALPGGNTPMVRIAALLLVVLSVPFAIAQSGGRGPSDASSAGAQPFASAPAMRATRMTARQVDARHCLDHTTNFEIIVCAEKYLPRRDAT
jgi:hypothetical protein